MFWRRAGDSISLKLLVPNLASSLLCVPESEQPNAQKKEPKKEYSGLKMTA
jgi:hypothetical protein